jgi:hypothetical protein
VGGGMFFRCNLRIVSNVVFVRLTSQLISEPSPPGSWVQSSTDFGHTFEVIFHMELVAAPSCVQPHTMLINPKAAIVVERSQRRHHPIVIVNHYTNKQDKASLTTEQADTCGETPVDP